MLVQESHWFATQFAAVADDALFPLLNVGSSTEAFRTRDQPWIDENLFSPMRSRHGRVIHLDMKHAAGVDLTGDVTSPAFQGELRALGVRSVMCSNLLEHVGDHESIAEALLDVLPSGGLLFVSCPYRYPRHDDPIDNMFRPAADELAALFPGARTLATETVVGGTYFDALDRSWVRVVRSIGRAALPFYAPARWKNTVRHLPWLVRRFAATCAVLEKSRA